MVHKPAPPGQEFWLHDGRQVRSVKELSEYLKEASKADYDKHVSKDRNDFANWVRHVHNNEPLAKALENSSTKRKAASTLAAAVKAHEKPKISKRTKPVKAPVKPEQKEPKHEVSSEERQIVKEVAKELDHQVRKTEAHSAHEDFITKEFVFGFLFGLILGLLATGILNALG